MPYVPAPYDEPMITVRWGTVELVTAFSICEPFLMMPSASKSRPTM